MPYCTLDYAVYGQLDFYELIKYFVVISQNVHLA